MSRSLSLSGHDLTLDDVQHFDTQQPQLVLSEDAQKNMQASVEAVQRVIETGKASYGINTGFGALASKRIDREQLVALQYNLVRSHACGVDKPLSPTLTRRLMLLKANSLAVGHSGLRSMVVETLLSLLNHDVLPVIPGKGSVGASGDLAPLAHLALALIGEGEAMHNGKRLEGDAVLKAAGCEPVVLQAKEGLALLNGTQLSAALAMEGYFQARTLLNTAITAGALSVEALSGSYSPFDARLHKARNMPGQIKTAQAFRKLLTGSAIHDDHENCERVQDPYALRCMPQVYGAVWDTLDHAENILTHELNSVSDNPLIFDDTVISGGNFHAEPLGFLADFMAIAVAELGNMSERRTDLLVRQVNPNLPLFLTATPGVESGFMIAHVTAAALASENKTYAHPASVDSIPTSAGQEDHVSMAPWAGHKLLQIGQNTGRILAIELMAASVALDILQPLTTTQPLQAIHNQIRQHIAPHTKDRRLDTDIAELTRHVQAGEMVAA